MSAEWPLVRLGDYVDACLGKMLDAKKNKGVPQPYLGNSNVRWGTFDLTDLAEMRFEPHEEDRYSLRPGDLIVCEGGEPGRCAIWAGPVGMKVQKALHRIRSKETLDNHYLFYWFRHADKTGLLEPYFTGTTIKHLTGRAVAALEVPLPPIEVQRAMVDVLRSLPCAPRWKAASPKAWMKPPPRCFQMRWRSRSWGGCQRGGGFFVLGTQLNELPKARRQPR